MDKIDLIVKIFEGQEKLLEEISELKIMLVKQEGILEKQEENIAEHIKRTNLLEDNIELLRTEVRPIQLHVSNIKFLGKLFIGFSMLIGIIVGIIKILDFF